MQGEGREREVGGGGQSPPIAFGCGWGGREIEREGDGGG